MLLSRIAYFFRAFNPFSRIKNFSLPFRIIYNFTPSFLTCLYAIFILIYLRLCTRFSLLFI